MALPQVNLVAGKVNWTPGAPVTGAAVTGFKVGLRSLTAVGSTQGVYPIQSPAVAANATTEALNAITATLNADSYATAVEALSANGSSVWSDEYQFQGVLPLPNPPTGVQVA